METLFIYGTLKSPQVQEELLGRKLTQTPAILKGFKRSKIKLDKFYPIIIRRKEKSIRGQIIKVTKEELKIIDKYETHAYTRRKVILKNEVEAWAYTK